MGNSTAHIARRDEINERLSEMTFRQICELVCTLEGRIAQLELLRRDKVNA
jgi:hypothetical protein